MNSAFPKLMTHASPVNMDSAKVGYFYGENYRVQFTPERPKRRLTMSLPPKAPSRPVKAKDHTGKKIGRLTAAFWWSGRIAGSSTWVVRCDCGNYEFRKRLSRWDERAAGHGDMCEICERWEEVKQQEAPSKKRQAERRLRWGKSLLAMGLSIEEVKEISKLNTHTKGKSAEQLRAEIKAAKCL